jgi:hypothetical protein
VRIDRLQREYGTDEKRLAGFSSYDDYVRLMPDSCFIFCESASKLDPLSASCLTHLDIDNI